MRILVLTLFSESLFLSPRAYVWVKKYSLCTGTPDFRANERDIRPNKSTC